MGSATVTAGLYQASPANDIGAEQCVRPGKLFSSPAADSAQEAEETSCVKHIQLYCRGSLEAL